MQESCERSSVLLSMVANYCSKLRLNIRFESKTDDSFIGSTQQINTAWCSGNKAICRKLVIILLN